eukprot:s244_g19.t1
MTHTREPCTGQCGKGLLTVVLWNISGPSRSLSPTPWQPYLGTSAPSSLLWSQVSEALWLACLPQWPTSLMERLLGSRESSALFFEGSYEVRTGEGWAAVEASVSDGPFPGRLEPRSRV